AVDGGLTGDEVQVVHAGDGTGARGLVRLAVEELDVRQLRVPHHVVVAHRIVDVEDAAHGGHDQVVEVRQGATQDHGVVGRLLQLPERGGGAGDEHEGDAEPFEMRQPHRHLEGRPARSVPVQVEHRPDRLEDPGELRLEPASVLDAPRDVEQIGSAHV